MEIHPNRERIKNYLKMHDSLVFWLHIAVIFIPADHFLNTDFLVKIVLA